MRGQVSFIGVTGALHDTPSPPLEEFVSPAVRLSAGGLFEEVDDGPPKLYIIKIPINGPP